jgi:hypothetical protein
MEKIIQEKAKEISDGINEVLEKHGVELVVVPFITGEGKISARVDIQIKSERKETEKTGEVRPSERSEKA